MMTDELPQLWALDAAAKAAGYSNWAAAAQMHGGRMSGSYASVAAGYSNWAAAAQMHGGRMSGSYASVKAHARTLQQLAKYERPPVDEAELKRRQDAREFAARGYDRLAKENDTVFTSVSWFEQCAERCRAGEKDDDKAVYALYEYACHRDNVTPVPVEEWGK